MARYDDGWPAYVPVAERRRQAEREVARLRRKGEVVAPVLIEGRAIATTAWGKAWCDNLERYRDYDSRLPRGRAYVRNGSVIDLCIAPREVTALVSGSEIYKVKVAITALPPAVWRAICTDCTGRIESLVELLQGRLSAGVMERLCRRDGGLFPRPADIRFSCTCLDHALMCKHVAAVLYGVGARLDSSPELLFRLRAVEAKELLAGLEDALPAAASPGERVLADHDVSTLFGIDIASLDDEGSGVSGEVAEMMSEPRARDVAPAASPPQKPTSGWSRAMPRKKTASPASSTTRQDVPPDRSRTATPTPQSSSAAAAPGRKTAARQTEPASRAAKASQQRARGSSPAGQATSGREVAATMMTMAEKEVAPRRLPAARSPAAQMEPVPVTSADPGVAQVLEAVLARLTEISRSLGDVAQLRADVLQLNRRLEEIAAVVAGQEQSRASTDTVPPAPPGSDAEPRLTNRKQQTSRTRRNAELPDAAVSRSVLSSSEAGTGTPAKPSRRTARPGRKADLA